MKTVMVVDGALNCAYDCFAADEELFAALFPGDGQDIEFIEDFQDRTDGRWDDSLSAMWASPLDRKQLRGIDGILFYGLPEKKPFYPNKRDTDLDGRGRGFNLSDLRAN